MISRIITLLLLFVVELSNGQTRTVVCGKITNPKQLNVKLSCWRGEQQEQLAKLNQQGYFHVALDMTEPWAYDIEHGEEVTHAFLFPGDSVYVTLDTKRFDETVVFSGTGKAVNNYLAGLQLHYENTLESEEFRHTYYSKIAFSDAQTFVGYADSIANVRLAYLAAYKDSLPAAFYDYQYAEIVFRYAKDKADYPKLHYYVRGIQDSVVEVDENYYRFYDQYPLDNEHYLASNYFNFFTEYYVSHYARKAYNRDSISPLDEVTTARKRLTGRVRQKAIEQIVLRSFSYSTQEMIEQLYAIAQAEISEKDVLALIAKRFAIASKLFKGRQAPGFTLKTKDGKLVSLRDFKGKVVYLDFWASWCGPCMMEVPAAKKLQDTFANAGIVFLYVSIDESKADWVKTVTAKRMKGVHLWAKGFEHRVAQQYNVQGIPRYVLINRDGTIANSNAARPSNPMVYEEIAAALRK